MIDVMGSGAQNDNEPSIDSDFFKALKPEDRAPRLQEFRALSAEDKILWKRLFIVKGGDPDTSGTYEKMPDGTERKITEKDELRASIKSARLQKKYGNPPGFTGSVVGSDLAPGGTRDIPSTPDATDEERVLQSSFEGDYPVVLPDGRTRSKILPDGSAEVAYVTRDKTTKKLKVVMHRKKIPDKGTYTVRNKGSYTLNGGIWTETAPATDHEAARAEAERLRIDAERVEREARERAAAEETARRAADERARLEAEAAAAAAAAVGGGGGRSFGRYARQHNGRPAGNERRSFFRRIADFFRRRPEPEVPSELRTWISEATTEREMTHRFAVARRALSDLREINVNEGSRIRDYADIQMKLNSKNREYARGMARSVLLGLAVATVAGAVVSGGSIPTLAILGKVACSSVVSYVTTKQLNQYLEKKKVRGAWAYSAVAGLAAGIATGDLISYLNGTSGLFVGGNTGTPERFAAIPSENPAQNAIDPAHRPEFRMPEFPPAADSVASGSIVSPPTTPQGITLVPGIHVDPPIAPGDKIVSIPEFDPGRVRAVLETMPNTADTATYIDGKMQLSDGFIANNFTYQFPQEYVVKAGDAVATKGIDGFLQTQILNTEGFKSLGLSKLAELQFIDAIRTVAINNPEYAEKLGARIVNGDLVYKAGDVIQASLIGKPDFVKDLLDTIATRESVLSRELIAKLGTLDHFGLELGRGVRA